MPDRGRLDRGRVEPPTILVLTAQPDTEAGTLRQVLAGIEEEGVPFEVVRVVEPDEDAATLATAAADRSSLRVGVGVSADGSLAATHRSLPEGQLFESAAAEVCDSVARGVGRHAARVVVGAPFSDE